VSAIGTRSCRSRKLGCRHGPAPFCCVRPVPVVAGTRISSITHRALRVEISRHDEEPSATGMFGGDRREHILVSIPGDKLAQASVPEKAGSENRAQNVWRIKQPSSDTTGINFPQCCIVGGAEKCKWRYQRADANPGNHRKFRARASRGPTAEYSRAVSAIGGARPIVQDS